MWPYGKDEALNWAVEHESINVAACCLENGADPDITALPNWSVKYRSNFLLALAISGDEDNVKSLLSSGYSFDMKLKCNGHTVFTLAISNNWIYVVEFALALGESINQEMPLIQSVMGVSTYSSCTVKILRFVVENKLHQVLKLLLAYGINPDTETPLLLRCLHDVLLVKTLIQHGFKRIDVCPPARFYSTRTYCYEDGALETIIGLTALEQVLIFSITDETYNVNISYMLWQAGSVSKRIFRWFYDVPRMGIRIGIPIRGANPVPEDVVHDPDQLRIFNARKDAAKRVLTLMCSEPRSLMSAARVAICRQLGSVCGRADIVNELEVPTTLKSYLNFDRFDD